MPGATVGGLPYPLPSEPVRDGAAGIQALATALDKDPDEMQSYRGSDITLNSGVWLKLSWTGTTYSFGSGLTQGGTSIVTNIAGRYWAQGFVGFPSNQPAAGRRLMGFADSNATQPLAHQQLSVPGHAGAQYLNFGCAVSSAAAAGIALFVFQDSGSNLLIAAANQVLTVRRLRK